MRRGTKDLPAHGIKSARQCYGVCPAVRSAAQQHGRARWSRQHADTHTMHQLVAISANRCGDLPQCCRAMLACSMRAQHKSDTTVPACTRYYHPHLPSTECPPRPQLLGHQVGDAEDETGRQRGARNVFANYVKVAFSGVLPGANTATATMSTAFVASNQRSWPRLQL